MRNSTTLTTLGTPITPSTPTTPPMWNNTTLTTQGTPITPTTRTTRPMWEITILHTPTDPTTPTITTELRRKTPKVRNSPRSKPKARDTPRFRNYLNFLVNVVITSTFPSVLPSCVRISLTRSPYIAFRLLPTLTIAAIRVLCISVTIALTTHSFEYWAPLS
jgi:ribosomal protein S30